jgi:hypothetical protein
MKKSPIIILIVLTVCWMLPSCEKEVFDVSPQMESFYAESVQLPTVSLDSVKSFSSKVDGFTKAYPLALEHEKYPLIRQNIKAASIRLTIEIDTTWAGEKHINF